MRLWSIHPRYLDAQGLVALWREALLAKAVLRGETKGYRQHPQLDRFRDCPTPLFAINSYLSGVYAESQARGYEFARDKIGPVRSGIALPVTTGQLEYEWSHLMAKLAIRNPALQRSFAGSDKVACHPLFRRRAGAVASWERATSA